MTNKKEKERLLRLIKEYGEGPEREGTTHYLKSSVNRRKGVFKAINKIIDGVYKKL